MKNVINSSLSFMPAFQFFVINTVHNQKIVSKIKKPVVFMARMNSLEKHFESAVGTEDTGVKDVVGE